MPISPIYFYKKKYFFIIIDKYKYYIKTYIKIKIKKNNLF